MRLLTMSILTVIPFKYFLMTTVVIFNEITKDVSKFCKLYALLLSSSFHSLVKSFPINNYKWGDTVYFSRDLDVMQTLDLDNLTNCKELSRRIKAFHTSGFPLKLKTGDKIYTLKKNA